METLFFFFLFFFDRKKTRWFFYVRNIIEFPPDFSTWKFPWIDRNTNRVRLTPFAVHPLLHERCNARGVDFTIFSDRFHYTGTTSVPIRPRWLKNSSLRLSVPSPPLPRSRGRFRGHFYVCRQKSSTTGHGYNCCIVILNDFRCLEKEEKKERPRTSRVSPRSAKEFQREKSEKGRVLSADVCTRCLWRDIITRNVSSVPKITKGGFLGKSKDDLAGDNKGRKIFFAIRSNSTKRGDDGFVFRKPFSSRLAEFTEKYRRNF